VVRSIDPDVLLDAMSNNLGGKARAYRTNTIFETGTWCSRSRFSRSSTSERPRGLPDPLTPSLPSDSIRLLVLPIARYEVLTNITNLQWCHPPTRILVLRGSEASQCGAGRPGAPGGEAHIGAA